MSEEDIKTIIKSMTITYGSIPRIQNSLTKFYLSSFGMNWSTGSGLQIVTVLSDKHINSLFAIIEGEYYPTKINIDPFLCGDIICLEHITMEKIYINMLSKVLQQIHKKHVHLGRWLW